MTEKPDKIARLEVVPIRQLFQNEARQFTTWLETHIDVLAERMGIELTVVNREKQVGDFNVDLLCEDENGKAVIIENQLEKTNHDHLGKLLTYLVNLDAAAAIWITPEPRIEHQKVIEWLNESTSADLSFFLVRVEAVKIGDSSTPLFTILSGPDRQTKEIGVKKKEWAERHYNRMEFWKGLLDKSRDRTKLFANISPGKYSWIGTGAGKSGVTFNYVIVLDWVAVELYIDHDRDTGEGNKAIFDELHGQKDGIEKEFGGQLEWDRLDDRRASRIRKRFTEAGLASPDSWPKLHDEMIDAMIRLERALKARLAKIEIA